MAIKEPRIIKGASHKDFGVGFYCTAMKEQAERWAKRFDTPVVSVYEYAEGTGLANSARLSETAGLNIKNFPEMTDEWLDFIADCRSGKPHKYDIVIGAMANDQVWNYVADFISGIITREAFWALAKFKRPTHQIAFCSEKALASIEFVSSFEVAK